MLRRILIPALAAAAFLAATSSRDAAAFELLDRLLGVSHSHGSYGCCESSCCAPEPSCCAPEPTCCAPEPVCCAPEPACCAPEPSCCEMDACCDPCGSSCCKKPCFPRLRAFFERCKSCCAPSCCEPSCCEPSCCEPVCEPACCAPAPSCCH